MGDGRWERSGGIKGIFLLSSPLILETNEAYPILFHLGSGKTSLLNALAGKYFVFYLEIGKGSGSSIFDSFHEMEEGKNLQKREGREEEEHRREGRSQEERSLWRHFHACYFLYAYIDSNTTHTYDA